MPAPQPFWRQQGHYALVVRGAWKRDSAIHDKEGRVALLGLRRASRSAGLHGHHLLSFSDNMACTLSIAKRA